MLNVKYVVDNKIPLMFKPYEELSKHGFRGDFMEQVVKCANKKLYLKAYSSRHSYFSLRYYIIGETSIDKALRAKNGDYWTLGKSQVDKVFTLYEETNNKKIQFKRKENRYEKLNTKYDK